MIHCDEYPVNSLRPCDAYMPSKLTIIDSVNGLSPGRRLAIIRTNARLENKLQWNFSRTTYISNQENLVKNVVGKWRPFCIGLYVLYKMCPLWHGVRPEQDDRHLSDDIFICISPSEDGSSLNETLLTFVSKETHNQLSPLFPGMTLP